jgi:type I restriction enzyme, S subunit
MSEAILAPKLRFPEFSGNWEEKKLGDIAYFFSGGTPISTNRAYYSGDIPFIGSGKINDSAVEQFITQEALEDSSAKMIDKGDLLYALYGATSGEVGISRLSGAINQAVLCIRSQENIYFLYEWLQDKKARILSTYLQGGQGNLSAQIIKSLKINLPTKLEQQKIATFLTEVDKKIEQLNKKQELLSKNKKGLLKKIFNKEIRFKADDGSDYPDWEEKKLGDVLDNVGGTALEKHTNPNSKYKFISIGNYGVNGKYIDNGQRVELNDKTKTKLLDKNNLVMVLNDKTAIGDIIGSTILIDKNDNYIYNQRSERLICKLELLPIFAWHYLNSRMFRRSVYSISQGGTQIYVNFPSVKDLKFNLPSKTEQIKISNFLSSVDSKIEQIGKQLDETKQFKKALLQQMFV